MKRYILAEQDNANREWLEEEGFKIVPELMYSASWHTQWRALYWRDWFNTSAIYRGRFQYKIYDTKKDVFI